MVCNPDQSTVYHLQFPCNLLWHAVSVSPILNIVPVSSHASYALIRQEKYSFYIVTKSFTSHKMYQYIDIGGIKNELNRKEIYIQF